MLKSIPNFVARTATALVVAATVVEIDQAGADMLREKLAEGDWTYASVADGISYEVVRIKNVTGTTISIDRNVENTGEYAFNSNAKMAYILGTKAVDDVIEDVLYSQLDMTGTGVAKVTRVSQFAWNIHVDKIAIVSDDPDITVIDMYPTFFINKNT
jgi:hypothetical protein